MAWPPFSTPFHDTLDCYLTRVLLLSLFRGLVLSPPALAINGTKSKPSPYPLPPFADPPLRYFLPDRVYLGAGRLSCSLRYLRFRASHPPFWCQGWSSNTPLCRCCSLLALHEPPSLYRFTVKEIPRVLRAIVASPRSIITFKNYLHPFCTIFATALCVVLGLAATPPLSHYAYIVGCLPSFPCFLSLCPCSIWTYGPSLRRVYTSPCLCPSPNLLLTQGLNLTLLNQPHSYSPLNLSFVPLAAVLSFEPWPLSQLPRAYQCQHAYDLKLVQCGVST